MTEWAGRGLGVIATMLVAGSVGCGEGSPPAGEQADTSTGADIAGDATDGSSPSDAAGDDAVEPDAGPDGSDGGAVTQVSDWCDAVRGGSPGARDPLNDLARAHVGQRLFGPTADWLGADATLVGLLDADDALQSELVATYAGAFPDVCAAEATDTSDAAAAVTMHGQVAVISPGTGAVTVPQAAERLIIDLRIAASDDDIAAALGLSLEADLTVGERRVRAFHGFPAQDTGWTHYEASTETLPITIAGTGDQDRALVLITPQRLSPAVATWVGALRLAGRAAIAGHDVHAAVAESWWSGVGHNGLAWRACGLSVGGVRWPDIIRADLETTSLDEVLQSVSSLSNLGPVLGTTNRSDLATYARDAGLPGSELSRGAMRAALLVAYGTLDWFYAYFDLVGRDLDDALLTALDEVDATAPGDRVAMKRIMGRFMHDLYDGHGFYWDDASEDWPDGWMALQIQQIDGLPVVRRSLTPGIEAGDTVLAVDATPIDQWYEEAMGRYSAASDGYRFVLATDELKEVRGAPQWELRDPDGVERVVTAQAASWDDVEALPWGGTDRPSGWLSDLGAPDVYFVNMANAVTPEHQGVVAELASAGDTAAVILDMRDYPYLDIYEFARSFNPEHFSAPLFGFPTWRGPWSYALEFEAWEFDPAPHVVDSPVILMVSNKSVSAAECFAQMVMGLDNVTVVGQQSASTNGTITTAWLPGRWEITFTGMRLLNPDESEFHGIGVVPDVEVTPTPAQFAAGVDPELEAAVTVLGFGD